MVTMMEPTPEDEINVWMTSNAALTKEVNKLNRRVAEKDAEIARLRELCNQCEVEMKVYAQEGAALRAQVEWRPISAAPKDEEACIEACTQQLRCFFTKNECGTDTWMAGRSCRCPNCQLWLRLTGNDKPALTLGVDAIHARSAPYKEGEVILNWLMPRVMERINRRRRALDMQILWPACANNAESPDHAKTAFASHALNDPAWMELGEEEVKRRIEALPMPPSPQTTEDGR